MLVFVSLRVFAGSFIISVFFQFLLLFILVAGLHVAVVLTYLVGLDRSFPLRTGTFCVADATCRLSSVGTWMLCFLNSSIVCTLKGVFLQLVTVCQVAESRLGVGVVGLPLLESFGSQVEGRLVVSPFCTGL